MPSTPHLSQPPVNPPDPVGVFEANFGRLPQWVKPGIISPMLKAVLSPCRYSSPPLGAGSSSAALKVFEGALKEREL
jgi:hypothetical protein